MKRAHTLIFAGILFLAACSPAPAEDTATMQPTSPPTSALPSTPSSTAIASSTKTTPPSPSRTFGPTLAAFYTMAVGTIEAEGTSVASTLEVRGLTCQYGYTIEKVDTAVDDTNGDWTAMTCSPDSEEWEHRYTLVKKHDGTQSWKISYNDFNWSQRQFALLKALHWNEILGTVYFSSFNYPGPGAFYAPRFLTTERVVYELDLNNGRFKSLFPELVNEEGYSVYYAYAFSPDLSYMVFNDPNDGTVLQILDLESNKSITIEIGEEYTQIGRFVWTLDNQKIVFAAALDSWLEGKAGISLISYSLKDSTFKTILYNDPNNYIPHYNWEETNYWVDDNILNLSSINIQAHSLIPNGWELDINTGFITARPTSTPYP